MPRHAPQGHAVPLLDRCQVQSALDAAVDDRLQSGRKGIRQTAVNRLAHHQGVAVAAQHALVGRRLMDSRIHRGDGVGRTAVTPAADGRERPVLMGDRVDARRQASAVQGGENQRGGDRFPGNGLTGRRGAQQHVFPHLVGTAPEEEFG